jgi:DNA-binding MarR family transcriptional regulator/N-acetylglutamate synthase-like GNAT family acetyltransferase
MDFIEELGTLALGTRIKNLGELLMKDMARIYREQGVDFEPRWFTFFQLILQKEEVSVTAIARDLKQTHPAVVQVISMLEKKGLVITTKDKGDKRKRLVRLSTKGKKLAEELGPVWQKVKEAAMELLMESEPGLLNNIASLERALQNKGMYDRIYAKIFEDFNIKMVGSNTDYMASFRKLNEDWLRQYLEISDHDRQVLADPAGQILNKGGRIYCMLLQNEVVGTYALQQVNADEWELSKFTVKKDFRGRKLGKRLLQHALQQAAILDARHLLLFTHPVLTEATDLYRNAGFREIEEHPEMHDPTGRCSILMKRSIHT